MSVAKVAKVINDFTLVLNAGKQEGLEIGQDFIVYREGEDVMDPDTGAFLGTFEQVIGRGVVTHVQDRIATLESSEVVEGGRKVVRKSAGGVLGGLASVQGLFIPTSEEVVQEPDKMKPFQRAMVGDLAKRI